jgi:uncharacterized peroxidase-related enzyme
MAWIEESELPDVPAIFQAMSLKPEALDVVKRLNEVLSFGNSGLTRTQEEGIATVVSVANRCRYGAMTHAGFLRRHSQNLEMASHFLCDYTQATLSSTDRRILDFAVQVTQGPSDLTEDDVDQLRDVGLDESQILAVVLIACLSNFMDRLANSLGVDLEPRHRRALENWLTGPTARQDWLMPLPVKPPADAPKKPMFGKSNGNVPHHEGSPNETTAMRKEKPADPDAGDSLLQADDFLSDLEDIINSGALANGSASDDEPEEEAISASPTLNEQDTYTSDDTIAGSNMDSHSPGVMESSSGQGHDTEAGAANSMADEDAPPQEPENFVDADPADRIGGKSESPSGQHVESGPSQSARDSEELPGAPVSGMEDPSAVQSGDDKGASNERRQSEAAAEEEKEPDPPIDVNPLIIQFVQECCKTSDEQAATARELYIAYLRWCDENDKQVLSQRDFGMNLSGMGFLRQRRARGRHWWVGIGTTPKKSKDDWGNEDI